VKFSAAGPGKNLAALNFGRVISFRMCEEFRPRVGAGFQVGYWREQAKYPLVWRAVMMRFP
jgi:hypothetical protein